MEIFLLIVLITLLVIFNSGQKSKLDSLYSELQELRKSLKNLQSEKTNNITQTVIEEIKPEPVESIQPITHEIPKFAADISVQSSVKKAEDTPAMPPVEIIDLAPEANIEREQAAFADRINLITPAEPKQSWWDKFKINNPDLEKFIGENLISKIGVAILVLGIGYFVKYAIDQNWINEWARAGIGILCGIIIMGFAHRLRERFKPFSSVLVAGAISVFYFTIAIAFHQYHLFGQGIAFAMMLFITAFSVFISIAYNRVELAALSLIGGFAAPLMISTGQGNYMALFTYVIILDVGMLSLAYLRKWNLINIIAYVFTALLYGGWLSTKVIGIESAPYKGALIFAAVFYCIFILMNIINNIKERRSFVAIELVILISNTFLFYSAGMVILNNYHPGLKGIFTIILACTNFICAWFLYKRFDADKRLVYLLTGLTLTFVTLAAPVQLHGNFITIFWAAEAVLLMWLAQRSKIITFRFASVIIQCLMFFSLAMDWGRVYSDINTNAVPVIFNRAFITGISCVLSFISIWWLLRKEEEKLKVLSIAFNPVFYRDSMKIAAIAVLYICGLLELYYQANLVLPTAASVNSIVAMYHLAFSFFTIFFISKTKHEHTITFAMILGCLNIFLFTFFYSLYPFTELQERLSHEHTCRLGFISHYFSLAFTVLTAISLRNLMLKKEFFSKDKNWLAWASAFIIVYVASSEVLLHGLVFFANTFSNTKGLAYEGWLNYQLTMRQIIKTAFPVLWGLLAFAFLTYGIRRPSRIFRISALLLLAITLLKLFIYDIQNVPEAGKIIAFILLGIVLLIMSFMYQKIKAIILKDESEKNNDNANNEIV